MHEKHMVNISNFWWMDVEFFNISRLPYSIICTICEHRICEHICDVLKMFVYIHLLIFYVKVFYAISHINPRIRSIPVFDSKQVGRSASAPVIPTKLMLLKISLWTKESDMRSGTIKYSTLVLLEFPKLFSVMIKCSRLYHPFVFSSSNHYGYIFGNISRVHHFLGITGKERLGPEFGIKRSLPGCWKWHDF